MLTWTFEKDNVGFVANQKVIISREIMDREHFLVCQSCQTSSTPGIRLMNIVLPTSKEYCLEIHGFANNKKTFLWVQGEDGDKLIHSYIYLPQLTEHKIKPTVALFYLSGISASNMDNSIPPEKRDLFSSMESEETWSNAISHTPHTPRKYKATITIGILIGGNEPPTTNDMFFIRKISIYEHSLTQNYTTLEAPQITRIYNSRKELEAEHVINKIKRDDMSLMGVGEYALIKVCKVNSSYTTKYNNTEDIKEINAPRYPEISDLAVGREDRNIQDTNNDENTNIIDNGRLYISYIDNGILRLRYLCNVLEKENIFTQAIEIAMDKIIPIYDDPVKANNDANNDKISMHFYDKDWTTERINEISADKKLFMYLDTQGYIRWTTQEKNKSNRKHLL